MPDLENKLKVNCYCCSEIYFENCCAPYLNKKKTAPTALALMRSRYSAYAVRNIDYLIETTAAATRKFHNKKDIFGWASENQWIKLEILNHSENTVEFKAYYLDESLHMQIHHEKSRFIFEKGKWFYLDYL